MLLEPLRRRRSLHCGGPCPPGLAELVEEAWRKRGSMQSSRGLQPELPSAPGACALILELERGVRVKVGRRNASEA